MNLNSFYQGDFLLFTAKNIRTSFGHVKKKQKELQQLVQNTILAIKCSRQYFLSDYLLHRSVRILSTTR